MAVPDLQIRGGGGGGGAVIQTPSPGSPTEKRSLGNGWYKERILISLVLLWGIRSPVLRKPTATLSLLDFLLLVFSCSFTTVLIIFSRLKCGACSRTALIRVMYEVTKSRTGILQCVYRYFEKGCRKKCTRQSQRYCGWL